MKLRLVSGTVAGAALILLILFGDYRLIAAIVLAFAVLGYREFDHLMFEHKDNFRILRICVYIAATILCLRHSLVAGFFGIWCSFVAIGIKALLNANRSGDFRSAMHSLETEWLGFGYIVGLMGFLLPILESHSRGREWLLLLFLVVFVGDSFAYFVGKFIGKRKLATRLSPKKTWEGALGGFFGSLLATYVWCQWTGVVGRAPFWLVISLVALLAQIGDLFESLFKRSQTQKDSGSFLPGHGGLLDRIDGLAFSSPIFYAFLLYQARVTGN